MARPRTHLERAPIAEAIIDFRVLQLDNVTAATFAALKPLIGAKYAQESPMTSIQARFGVVAGKLLDPSQLQTNIGYRYQSETEIAQFRLNGFTFSKIAPYTTWEEVFAEAFRLWSVYTGLSEPREVSRIAVRYINRMQVAPATDLRRYLEAPPSPPSPIPQAVREFLTRIVVDDEKRNASAVIVQALEPRLDQNAMSLLLDIDAFRAHSVTPNDPGLPAAFEQLRELKNEIFFASITETTAEMYA
jgi:uncharacterized protein (TIGR04255 family)